MSTGFGRGLFAAGLPRLLTGLAYAADRFGAGRFFFFLITGELSESDEAVSPANGYLFRLGGTATFCSSCSFSTTFGATFVSSFSIFSSSSD